jgi:uncharacterized protein (TIGR01244 family)
MECFRVTEDYAVAPQIEPSDAGSIRGAGFTDVICNRPDEEVTSDLSADAISAALSAEGVHFHVNPVRHGALTESEVARQAEIIADAKGPVLAYCRSGTRSTIVWALGEGELSPDEIVAAAGRAGYDIAQYRPYLSRTSGLSR